MEACRYIHGGLKTFLKPCLIDGHQRFMNCSFGLLQDYVLPALQRWWRLKLKKNVYTQETMNELFSGPTFSLSDK